MASSVETSILEELVSFHPKGLATFTVDQYHHMIESGAFGEERHIELIDGLLVRNDRRDGDKPQMNVGPRHSLVVVKLTQLFDGILPKTLGHSRAQQPITLQPDQEPEPDVSVAIGAVADFATHHPQPEDLVVVIEVSDTSLRYDQQTKQRVYANASIACYWIVNLAENRVEVYEQPQVGDGTYAVSTRYSAGDTIPIALPSGEVVNVPADDVLP